MSCGCGCDGSGPCGGSSWVLVRSGPPVEGVVTPQPLWFGDPEPMGAAFGAPSDCTQVATSDGLDSRNPCNGMCAPWHASSWNATARAYVDALEAAASTPDEYNFAADFRRRFNALDHDVPSPWAIADRVNDYVLLSQQAACALQAKAAAAAGGSTTGGGAAEDEGTDWSEWIPSLPSLPSWSWPTMPKLPSWSWPTIPEWAWWAGGGVLLLYLLAGRRKGSD